MDENTILNSMSQEGGDGGLLDQENMVPKNLAQTMTYDTNRSQKRDTSTHVREGSVSELKNTSKSGFYKNKPLVGIKNQKQKVGNIIPRPLSSTKALSSANINGTLNLPTKTLTSPQSLPQLS